MSRAVVDFILNSDYNASSTVNMYHVSHPENLDKNLDMLNEVLYQVSAKTVIQVNSLMDFKISKRKRVNNIIFIDSFESFRTFYEHIDHDYFEYQGYYLIAVTVYTNDNYYTMLKIFQALWMKKIINANILHMLPDNTNDALLYTYYPYSKFYCEDVIPIQHNQFRGHRWMKIIDYYPKKLTNFYGCHLHVATFNNPPFMLIKKDDNEILTVDGVDGMLLRVLAQRFNFNVDLHPQTELFGTIFKNGTTTGSIKMVVEQEANFTLGFFASMPARDAVMQPSFVYFTTNLLWIVPPGKPQSPLEKLANPLKYIVWIWSSLTIVIGFIVIGMIKMQPMVIQKFVFGNKTKSPGMNFINIILGNSLHQVPMRNFSRFLFLLATIYFFIIRTCFSSGLVKFMQMDTREQHMMKTSELVNENFTFYMKQTGTGRDYVLKMPEVLKRVKLLPNPEFDSKLNDMIDDPYYNAAFLTTTGHLAFRNRKLYPDNFHVFAQKPLYNLNIVIYMNLGSCLRVYFNQMLMAMISSGLIYKWASEFIDERYLKRPEEDELKSLSLDQLEGAFQLLVGGLLAAFIVFCGENIIRRESLRIRWKLIKNDSLLFIKAKKLKMNKKK